MDYVSAAKKNQKSLRHRPHGGPVLNDESENLLPLVQVTTVALLGSPLSLGQTWLRPKIYTEQEITFIINYTCMGHIP